MDRRLENSKYFANLEKKKAEHKKSPNLKAINISLKQIKIIF